MQQKMETQGDIATAIALQRVPHLVAKTPPSSNAGVEKMASHEIADAHEEAGSEDRDRKRL